MASVTRFIEDSLRLTVDTKKSAADCPWKCTFLGFTVSCNEARLKVADKAIDKLKAEVREGSVDHERNEWLCNRHPSSPSR